MDTPVLSVTQAPVMMTRAGRIGGPPARHSAHRAKGGRVTAAVGTKPGARCPREAELSVPDSPWRKQDAALSLSPAVKADRCVFRVPEVPRLLPSRTTQLLVPCPGSFSPSLSAPDATRSGLRPGTVPGLRRIRKPPNIQILK